MVDGAPRIGSKARSVTLEASVDLENVQWNEITATAVDSAADADGIYWFIPAPKTGDANVYRFFKIAE